ncbi:MAG: hypothetical protein H6631_18505 [Anaerolineaceae bacterium]|nr:hypothetical protein [Anaerolineaceae bacterium]
MTNTFRAAPPWNDCMFGGVKRNRLFITASHSVYALYVETQGAPFP